MGGAFDTFANLGIALAIGLLIGLERGWHARKAEEGERVAGLRTYGLIGLFGGASVLLADAAGQWLVALALLSLAIALTTAYVLQLREGDDSGITSLVASLLTFVFGALSVSGEPAVAAAAAVVTTLLLSYKPQLHRWLRALSAEELNAALKLLLISVVLLPILPNQDFGPFGALNPYAIWWMVVLIALISFVGYFAVRIGGARRGVLFTGLFGGIASSTAVTLHFSRMARNSRAAAPILSAGMLLSCGTMFPRMLLVATALNTALFVPLLVPALVMAAIVYVPALIVATRAAKDDLESDAALRSPLQLGAALGFGLLLALVLFLGKALQQWLGDEGVLALAAASGITDVDAITLSLSRMSGDDLSPDIAVTGIVIAAAVNGLTKGAIATFIGGREVGLRTALPLVAAAAGGLATLWIW